VALLILMGCGPGEVLVSGKVDAYLAEDPEPLQDGTVTIAEEDGSEYASDRTDAEGEFEVPAPAGDTIYALINSEGEAIVSFTGNSGFDSELKVPDNTFYGVPTWQKEEWESTFAGCPGIGDRGLILGQVHVFLPGVELGDDTVVNAARVRATPPDVDPILGDGWEACYLTAEGDAWDPEAQRTGASGWYAIPDLARGQYTLLVEVEFAEGLFSANLYRVWMPPGGVAPRFPTLVDFPTPR
jgi:hypothetical protein